MGKKASAAGNRQTQTSSESGQMGPDAVTQQRGSQIYNTAERAGGQIPPSVQAALDFMSGKSDGSQFQNPFQRQVIDAANEQFDRSGQLALRGVNDAATRAGAFGGSRQGVAAGVAQGENERNRNAQISGLLQSGFQDSTQRALAAAGMGAQFGNPDLFKLDILKKGFSGLPFGQQYSGTAGKNTTDLGFKTEAGFQLPGLGPW